MTRAAWIAAPIVLAVACTRAMPRPTTQIPRRPPAQASPPPNSGVVLLPRGREDLVGLEPDGWTDIVGSGRYQAFDDEVRFASQNFTSDVVAAWRTPTGWVFVASDGATARADTFLGPLTRMRDLDHLLPSPWRSRPDNHVPRELVLVVDEGGTAWSSDGRRDWTPVRLPIPGRAMSAATAAPRRGLIVVEGGYLVHTEDGGASWALFPGIRAQSAEEEGSQIVTRIGATDLHPRAFETGESTRGERAEGTQDFNDMTRASLASRHRADPRYIDELTPLTPLADGTLLHATQHGLVFYDGATGRVRARRELPLPRTTYGWRLTPLPDGSVLARSGFDEELRMARYASDGSSLSTEGIELPPDTRPDPSAPQALPEGVTLPAGAERWAFAGERGMAWQRDPLRFYRTLDGGRRWEPWEPPIDGIASASWLGLIGRSEDRCSRWRCVIGRMAIWGWGPTEPGPRPFFARQTPEPRPRALPAWPDLGPLREMRCVLGRVVRGLPTYPPTAFHPGTLRRLLPAPDGEVELSFWTASGDRPVGTIRWRGRDGAGPWVSPSIPWSGDARRDPSDFRQLVPSVRTMSREVLLLDSRLLTADGDASSMLARASGDVHRVDGWRADVIATPEGLRYLRLDPQSFASVLPLDTTEGSLDHPGPASLFFSRSAVIARVGLLADRRPSPDGVGPVTDNRALAETWRTYAFVAQRAGVAGVLTVTDPARREAIFHPLSPAGAPSALPLPEQRALRPCAGADGHDTTSVTYRERSPASWGLTSAQTATTYTIELSATAMCVRRVEAVDRTAGVALDARPDGTFAGWITQGGRQRELRCTP